MIHNDQSTTTIAPVAAQTYVSSDLRIDLV